MFWLLLAGCDWGSTESKPPPTDLPPVATGPVLPPPPRVGVAEVPAPPGFLLPTEVREAMAPAAIDVWFDADTTTFDALGKQLDDWGFTRVDGDGESWRVVTPNPEGVVDRLLLAPGVWRAEQPVLTERLPSGATREGSAVYGALTHTWSWVEGGAKVQDNGDDPVPAPVLPRGLSGGALQCLRPLVDDLQDGLVQGVGWERALVAEPRAWGVLLEEYGACRARGAVVLRADGAVDTLTFGGRSLADCDAECFQSLAAAWVAVPHAATDPAVDAVITTLAEAPDVILARAMRDAAPGPVQARLYEAFEARDAEAALAVAGGSASRVLRAQTIGQDETVRQQVLADPAAKWSDIAAALVGWRPGPSDPPGLLDRFLASPDATVRARAQEARMAAEAGACQARNPTNMTVAEVTALYTECPQAQVRTAALARLRALDPKAADAALATTLESPETIGTGVAAVRAAEAAGRKDLLVLVVGRQNVARPVRQVALSLLVKANHPEAAALVAAHGTFLGYRALPNGTPGAVTDGRATP